MTLYCPNCGTKNDKGSKFCQQCGEAIPSMEEKESHTEPGESILSGTGLIDPNQRPAQLMNIKCDNCGHTGDPKKWSFRTWVGVAYLFTLLNIIGVLIYFTSTNPYICEKCDERNKLKKMLNDRKIIPIKSSSKNNFATTAIVFLILGVILTVIRVSTSSI